MTKRDKKEVINKVINYLGSNFKNEDTGHDYWHFIRVWKMAKKIAEAELPNLFSDKRKKQDNSQEELIDELYKIIGQRDMELDWLKKKLRLAN